MAAPASDLMPQQPWGSPKVLHGSAFAETTIPSLHNLRTRPKPRIHPHLPAHVSDTTIPHVVGTKHCFLNGLILSVSNSVQCFFLVDANPLLRILRT